MSIQAASHPPMSSSRDREPIRIDFPDDRLGITAALRRAFCEAASERSTHDFDRLLSELD